jgi:hypothetical protein
MTRRNHTGIDSLPSNLAEWTDVVLDSELSRLPGGEPSTWQWAVEFDNPKGEDYKALVRIETTGGRWIARVEVPGWWAFVDRNLNWEAKAAAIMSLVGYGLARQILDSNEGETEIPEKLQWTQGGPIPQDELDKVQKELRPLFKANAAKACKRHGWTPAEFLAHAKRYAQQVEAAFTGFEIDAEPTASLWHLAAKRLAEGDVEAPQRRSGRHQRFGAPRATEEREKVQKATDNADACWIEHDHPRAAIFTPYNRDLVGFIKSLCRARWNGEQHCWVVPSQWASTIAARIEQIFGCQPKVEASLAKHFPVEWQERYGQTHVI